MKKIEIEKLERCIGQVDALWKEIGMLSKKSPNDAVNKFKIKFVNKVLLDANTILTDTFKPFDDFVTFEEETAPSNSDMVFMLAQYAEALELYRSENIRLVGGKWQYYVDFDKNEESKTIRTRPPATISRKV